MAVSCAPVPVRSQIVTSLSDLRPGLVPAITSPSSGGSMPARWPASCADRSSPTFALCETRSQTKRSAARDRQRLDLVLAGLVGAHGGDVQAGMQPSGLENRLACRRRRHDQLAVAHQGGGIVGCGCRRRRSPWQCRVAQALALAASRPQTSTLENGRDQMSGLDLQPRLHARAEHAGHLAPLAAPDGARRPRPPRRCAHR